MQKIYFSKSNIFVTVTYMLLFTFFSKKIALKNAIQIVNNVIEKYIVLFIN